jgi:uncharacterized membrane protein (UPF0136 family)
VIFVAIIFVLSGVAIVVGVVLCAIAGVLVIIVATCVAWCHSRAREGWRREKGCQGANSVSTWWCRGSVAAPVVVEIAIVSDGTIVVFIICGVIAVCVIFVIGIIVVETGIVIFGADAIIGCIVRLWLLAVEGKGKQGHCIIGCIAGIFFGSMFALLFLLVNEKSNGGCGIHFVGVSVVLISIIGPMLLFTGRKSKRPSVWLLVLFTGANSTELNRNLKTLAID